MLNVRICAIAFSPLLWFSNTKVLAEQDLATLNLKSEKSAKICPQNLSPAIEKIIELPQYKRSRWGIVVQTLDDRQTLYSKNNNKFFTPASSLKLLTTAAVLTEFDADENLTTPIFAEGSLPNLTSLRLAGRGDPSLSTASLERSAARLKKLGVRKIEQLIVDDSYFQSPAINPTWEWLDVRSYFATAVNSTILNQNTVTLTLLPQELGQPVKYLWQDAIAGKQWQVINQGITGKKDLPYDIEIDGDLGKPVLKIRGELAINNGADIWDLAVVDPGNYFLESWRLALEKAGIEVFRGVVIQENQDRATIEPMMTLQSSTIAEIIQEINQESNNLYAEAIAKVLAKKLNLDDPNQAISDGLSELGIDSQNYLLNDASGLSRQNLATPQVLVETLEAIWQLPADRSQAYKQSLAVAGISGTLKRRFRDSQIRGRFWGKTGTLTGVNTLAGYLYPQDRPPLIVAIVVNNSELSSREIRQGIDRVMEILYRLQTSC